MKSLHLAVILVALLAATACGTRAPRVEPAAATSTIPNLAFTDTTPLPDETTSTPVLDENAALTCLSVRAALSARKNGDQLASAGALSEASFYISATQTPGFSEHVQSLVLLAASGPSSDEDLAGLTSLCDSLLGF
jgi:hypothetical protein